MMVRSFKLRMLLVIFLVAAAGLAMQSGESSRRIAEPVIRFMLKDYGVEQKIASFIDNLRDQGRLDLVPARSSSTLALPCEYITVKKNYGWHWNSKTHKQEFSPGIYLEVNHNTAVKPILDGRVIEISSNEEGRQVLLEHNENFYSFYGGLDEVFVEEGKELVKDSLIGKTGNTLYFEIRNQDGPQDPTPLFE
ncbi:murein hydrolase activator EnvC family protein [Syntrophomonas wolfei]|nr:M23 family metallopeptidase [Syntrophomonas wolfei]